MKEVYKKTVVGAIPETWKIKTISEVMDFQCGAQPPKENFSSEEREEYVRLTQIRDYKTDNYKTYIPVEKARKFCAKDGIMIGRYGPPIFQILKGLEGAYQCSTIKGNS